MVTPTPRPGTGQSIARSANGGNPGGLGGRRPGLAPVGAAEVASDAAGDGIKEVFEIPGFVPGTHNLGYCHWIFDEDGTFP